jgi:DNA-binding NarL/FixJ family response regulator
MHRNGTVLVVDDEEGAGIVFRRYLSAWNVVQAYTLADGEEELDRLGDGLSLLVLDLNLPDARYEGGPGALGGSFALARRVRERWPRLPVIIFSAHHDGAIANATHLVGATFLCKEDHGTNLRLLASQLSLAERAGCFVLGRGLEAMQRIYGLSRREMEVAALACRGLSRQEIAADLSLKVETVKSHVTRLYRRTQTRNGRALVALAASMAAAG